MSAAKDDPGVDTRHSGLVVRLEAGVNSVMHKVNKKRKPKVSSKQNQVEIVTKVNKLLSNWNNEEEPFVCPSNVEHLSSILGLDLSRGPSVRIVRVLKDVLRTLSLNRELSADDVQLAIENIKMISYLEQDQCRINAPALSAQTAKRIDVKDLARGGVQCVNCEKDPVMHYCLVCLDFMCNSCSSKMHGKGKRRSHKMFSLKRCEVDHQTCPNPATVRCRSSMKSFCAGCYSDFYLPSVPIEQRSQPSIINYSHEWEQVKIEILEIHDQLINSDTRNDWFPFSDLNGVQFFYNFIARESRCRSQGSIQSDYSSVCDERSDVIERIENLVLKTFNFPFN